MEGMAYFVSNLLIFSVPSSVGTSFSVILLSIQFFQLQSYAKTVGMDYLCAEKLTEMSKKVLVGMSGGVDSTAACLLLQEQGWEVVGLTMRVFDIPSQCVSGEPRCVVEAREVAARLGIEHHVVDVREEFRSRIVGTFCDEYMHGRTPNPCVLCNPLFKFRLLVEWADRLGCSHIATGHYVRVKDGYLCEGRDKYKDQSYFLWRVAPEVLQRSLFPLGEMTKDEVRAYLVDRDFALKASEGESMEICFIEHDYREFLRSEVPDLDQRFGSGRFVDNAGRTLGLHKGCPYYTVGQRKGLGIALGQPAFVLRINAERNTVVLGSEEDLKTTDMLVETPAADLPLQQWKTTPSPLAVRIRYRSRPVPCEVKGEVQPGLTLVHLLEPVSGIAPGQSAVFYDGERLLGGAFIASQKGLGQYK